MVRAEEKRISHSSIYCPSNIWVLQEVSPYRSHWNLPVDLVEVLLIHTRPMVTDGPDFTGLGVDVHNLTTVNLTVALGTHWLLACVLANLLDFPVVLGSLTDGLL